MKKPTSRQPYLLSVKENILLTPHMRRLILTGSDLARFPATAPSSYVKLMFDRFGAPLSRAPDIDEKVLMRTYTVRYISTTKLELHLDMALHGDTVENGPASHWAKHARPGSTICVGGPGAGKPLFADHDWVVFAGDMSSLPAIANHLEHLTDNTRGYALLCIPDKRDIQPLIHPRNVDIHWLIDEDIPVIADNLASLSPHPGVPAYWIAAEFSLMRALRQVLTHTLSVSRDHSYISSYWRYGRAEDQHKIDKKHDSDAFEASLSTG
ncbi:siderophore-interacting protein [Alteromonas sp. H39]|uniref:siderophore-interacting protein n=1 Tax=Alteromonas sp. H39 TaxID=3389876 RepID=UPI0039DFB994